MKYIIFVLLFSKLLAQELFQQDQSFLDKNLTTNVSITEYTSLQNNNTEQNTLVTNEKKESKSIKPSLEKVKPNSRTKKYFVEFKPAYFHYQDSTARSIFGHGGYMSIFGFDVKVYKYFHAWTDVGFLFDSGKVTSVNSKEKLTLIPVSLGLKYLYTIKNKVSLYAKIGPNWTYVSTKTDYPYVQSRVSKNNFGALFGVGSLISLCHNFSLDLFFDYIYNKKSFTDSNCNLIMKCYFGGFAVGAGLGYSF